MQGGHTVESIEEGSGPVAGHLAAAPYPGAARA
jgi:hypothetical protein